MLYVLSRSIGQSRNAGLASAFGLALGGVALAFFTALAGTLFQDNESLFRTVQIIGGIYLVYLGVSMLWSARKASLGDVTDVPALPFGTIVRQGFLVELFNPKTVLFFLAFLPGFIDEDASSIWLQMLILGILVPLTAVPTDVFTALFGAFVRQGFSRVANLGMALEAVGGIIVVGLGIRVLLM